MNAWVAEAVLELVKGADSSVAICRIGPGDYSSEWEMPNGEKLLCHYITTGEIKAVIANGTVYKSLPEDIGRKSSDFKLTAIFATLLASVAVSDNDPAHNDAAEALAACMTQYEADGSVPFVEFVKLTDYVQSGLNEGKIRVNAAGANGNNIDTLSKSVVTSGGLSGEVIFGKPTLLKKKPAKKKARKITVDKAKAMFSEYALSRKWTAEQTALIRSFPDDYIVPEEIIEMAECFIVGRGTKLPSNNMCWRGITGCGKSTGAALLSCILNTPLFIMTCYTSMETADFLSSLVPATASRPVIDGPLPDIDDIWIDPEGSYTMLTGEERPDVTSQECLEAYGRRCAEAAEKEQNGGTRFVRVNSEFVKAMEIGAICEIQEFSRIRDSGVLVGLNEFDHAGARIPLVDGTYTVRHPDAICLWTDNIGYSSCRPVDPSVMRRMALVVDTFELDKKLVVERALYNTENVMDKDIVSAMYDVWSDVREFCDHEDITEGEMSPSDLESWIARTAKAGVENAMNFLKKCVISKLTTDREVQERIISGAARVSLEKHLTPYM